MDTTKLEHLFVCSHGLFLAVHRAYAIAVVWLSSAILVHQVHVINSSGFDSWEDVFFNFVMGLLPSILLLLEY